MPAQKGPDGHGDMYIFRRHIPESRRKARVKNRRVHMANERTFLSWIRTSIGIMAFGFVIEKFIVAGPGRENGGGFCGGFSCPALLGAFLLLLGAAAGLLATWRFLRTEREIVEDTYRPSIVMDILIAILLGAIGLLLVIYLVRAA